MNYTKYRIHAILSLFLSLTIIPYETGTANHGISSQPVLLQNTEWKIFIQPDSFAINAEYSNHNILPISNPTDNLGIVNDISVSNNEMKWYYPEQKTRIHIRLERDYLSIQLYVEDTVNFQFPVISLKKPAKALIWPHNEGNYIPIDDVIWMEHLKNQNWNTLEGLSMPFWGMVYEDYILTYIITNPFHNQISFKQKENSTLFVFEHEIPPNHSEKTFGFEIHLSKNTSPVEPAKIFREYLIRQHQFVTLKEKIQK